MPRALRLQFAHAIYHVINRGNYRAPVFASEGAARAFEQCLLEAVALHRLRLHAFVIMSNHYHLAVETPGANLTESVHWLNSTYSNRFNRFRRERGHLFQGRYHAGLVQPGPSLLRVVNYIHLNPVRAGLTDLAELPNYRWSSLRLFLHGPRPEGLCCVDWLRELFQSDEAEGWQIYRRRLAALAVDPGQQKEEGFESMDRTWAIGDKTWREEVVASFRDQGAAELPCGPERDAIRSERWRQRLKATLREIGRTQMDLKAAPKGATWKVALAAELRRTCGANFRWLACELSLGTPDTARHQVSCWNRSRNSGS